MPERFLEIVRQSNGVDTVVTSFPLSDKDTVRLHHEGDDIVRAVIRHPRTQYDKVEREIIPGQPEVVLVEPDGDVEDPDVESATPSETSPPRRRITKRETRKSTAKKSTQKKSTAKK